MGTTCSIWVGWNDRKLSYIFVFYVKLEILLGKAKGNIFPLQFPDSQLSSMPRSVRPASLKNSCIHFIAKNEDLWSQPDISCLVAPVMEKLLKAVLGRVQKARHLWWNFQNSGFFGVPTNHVEYLQWNPLELFSEDTSSLLLCESIDDAFTKFLQRCRQLTHLKLNTLGSPLGGRVYDLLSGCDLSNLWVLNMDHMELGNDALGVIGSCCPKLRELRLGCVSGVNDDTLKLLIKKGPDGQCVLRHLKVLDLESTGVWDFGIQYALTSIPTIAHLNHYRMLPAALELLHRGSVITPFQLEKLDVRDMNVLFCIDQNCAGYPLDMSAFSKVKDIAIVLEYHKELELLKGFYPLLTLDKLHLKIPFYSGTAWKLSRRPSDESYKTINVIPFEPHVSGLIQNVGSSLKQLELYIVSQVSFLTIGQLCPNLRHLTVSFLCVKPEVAVSDLQSCFQHVEYTSLRRCGLCEYGDASPKEYGEIFLALLSPMHKIKCLTMHDISLGKRFLFDLISRNRLSCLEVLSLFGNSSFMTNSDMLLFFEDCPRLWRFITDVDGGLELQCKARGWDIECPIEFVNYWHAVHTIWCNGITSQWRHNGGDGVSNHQRLDYLLNRLSRRRSKRTSKLRVTGLCEWNSPMTGGFLSQRASNAENFSFDNVIMVRNSKNISLYILWEPALKTIIIIPYRTQPGINAFQPYIFFLMSVLRTITLWYTN